MSPIKVLGISGSPRKGKNTGSLLQAAFENALGVGRRVTEVARALREISRAE